MKKLPEEVKNFFQNQGFVIVNTIDPQGYPHSSCKGIVKISKNGKLYLLDLYRGKTFENLKNNPQVSITAVNEHKFHGFCLKGKAAMLAEGKFNTSLSMAWEERIASRITQRLLKNVRGEEGVKHHPEALLPQPEYLIAVEVEEIIDLTPQHLKKIEV
ncbi:MAG: pyridoxamine 5'-phosphate oxidase family protein [Candidatus Omnitrophica bacterium]|nr:pyridoxamine 5'-phosphate oxidase family protein [Candidatus Omnitrophota bacterium]